ncbi:hypothetical protein D0S45_02265 [Marinifilum sp. JC120]|nr:hypothetical protein D0S45_02265 [Marinifilum sp. JC120]
MLRVMLFILMFCMTVPAYAVEPDKFIDLQFRQQGQKKKPAPAPEASKPKITQETSKQTTIRKVPAQTYRAGDTWTEPITGMEFVWVPGGCFKMGESFSSRRNDDEGPDHEVCVDGFWMGKFEVTNGQFRKLKSSHKSYEYEGQSFNGFTQPAKVSWDDATAFAKWLSKKGNVQYRLPTEAEWEYACRAGSTDRYFWGYSDAHICRYANVSDSTARRVFKPSDATYSCDDGYAATAPVGSYEPNRFGLHDMLGNLSEWCEDWYDKEAYSKHDHKNPVNKVEGKSRVHRGGSWHDGFGRVRTADRNWEDPSNKYAGVGFRLVLKGKVDLGSAKLVTSHPIPKGIKTWTEPTTGMKFVRVPSGCFKMGAPLSEKGRDDRDEGPVHEVCVDGFWMGMFEVTNAQFRNYMPDHDSKENKGKSLDGDTQPAVYVSWNDATAFAKWLSGKGNGRFRLPTEAEWEYACRAGTNTPFFFGETISTDLVNYHGYHIYGRGRQGVIRKMSLSVGSLVPNDFGLYDMHGNVWEWVEDWYNQKAYSTLPRKNPVYSADGYERVYRGGSWYGRPENSRSASRGGSYPSLKTNNVGFRLVRIE